MATPHHSRRGSKAYYPRVRTKNPSGTIRSWPEEDGKPKIQAFAGYKVGMTHVTMTDYRKFSMTSGQSIFSAATVVEVPPMLAIGIRYYGEDWNGLKSMGESWVKDIPKELLERIPLRKKETAFTPDHADVFDVRLIIATNPSAVTGIPAKVPEIFEARVAGGTIKERIDFSQQKLGKELKFSDFSKAGSFIDVIGVTKGKGFTGHVERFGVKLLPRKNRKHRRMIGTLGPWHPNWVRNTVPQAGQMGYQQRTVHNIRVLKYSDKSETDQINVKGGYPGYGLVRNDYVLLHGSIPGPSKRLIKFREPSRQKTPTLDAINISYVSIESKQGD